MTLSTKLWSRIDKPDARRVEIRQAAPDVVDLKADVMDAGATLVQEAGDL